MQFTPSTQPLRRATSIQFGVISPEQAKAMSVTQFHVRSNGQVVPSGITRPEAFANGEPVYGGVNDPRMGNTFEKEHPGYFGHIELARPVYHVGFIDTVLSVLRCVSVHTSKLMIPETSNHYRNAMKKRGKKRLIDMVKACRPKKKCEETGNWQPAYKKEGLKILMEFPEKAEGLPGTGERKQDLPAHVAYQIMKKISDKDCRALGLNPKWARPEWLVVSVLPVPPPHVRPSIQMGSTARCEDDLTHKISDIVKANIAVANAIRKGEPNHIVDQFVMLLQYHVATFVDNQIPGQPQSQQRSGKPLKTIRQRLVGKEGRVRGNLMGKRVDFSARTVITADPNLSIDQVGVPRSIASNLTVPVRVTSFNINKMRELVSRGPDEHPGAKYIIRDDGNRIDLSFVNTNEVTLRKGWIVERHLDNDDVVLFNRQPSLHKMSIMGHRVRVLDWSTFRLNLSVTSPYNADFDGDEMNLHVPQGLAARAEAETLMMVNKVIVSPQSNRPVMGIVQDSLLASAKMTKRDVFMEKDFVMNNLMWVDDWDGRVPIPAVMIPNPNKPGDYTGYWTGKQIFSMILPKLNLVRKSNGHADDETISDLCPNDTNVLIEDGEIIMGNLDKKSLGTGGGGLIHVCFNEHGPEVTRIFMNSIQKLVNYWILQVSFTVGLGDAIADHATVKQVVDILGEAKERVSELVKQGQKGELEIQPGRTMQESFEDLVNMCLNNARDNAGKRAEQSLTESNSFKATVTSGSKGSFINISQIMACVGQQNVEGKRIPYGFRHRTLPHFSKDDLGPESRGFVENSYLKGLSPQEFYFHAMGGREGLIDTACKTAETGYIQRRLVKALEDVMVRYDGTVRNGRNDIIQFLYGEDGMDGGSVETQSFQILNLTRSQLEERFAYQLDDIDFGYYRGRPYMESRIVAEIHSDPTIRGLLREEFEQLLEDQVALRSVMFYREPGGARVSDKNLPLPLNITRLILNAQKIFHVDMSKPSDLHPRDVVLKLRGLLEKLVIVEGDDPLSMEAQDNATQLFRIKLREELASKVVLRQYRLSVEAFDWLIGMIESRFNHARVNPGEMCGVLAAQSIGEPATQMTLNTFHYAGVSAKNVTLGVPRLKEIINISKKVKTPSLTVYLTEECRRDEDKAKDVMSRIEYTTLKDLAVETMIVYDPNPGQEPYSVIEEDRKFLSQYYLVPDDDHQPEKLSPWVLRFELSSEMQFKNIDQGEIVRCIERDFADAVKCLHSDDNSDKLILRIRLVQDELKNGVEAGMQDSLNEVEEDVFLRKLEHELLHNMMLRGIPAISKVFIREHKALVWDDDEGFVTRNEWVLDTEGTNMLEVMNQEGVDHKRTVSNDVVEIIQVLGIEAVRRALLNELRAVISFDGSYVNYRHLSILVDVMTYRGCLMAVTRHGINRVDSGPLMRASFEETVEILMDAAAFSELDPLTGVSENIMLGQLAPLGTGVFDLVLDEDMLENAIEMDDEDEIMETGVVGGGMRGAQFPGTPGAFSPGTGAMSPGMSPGMMSPSGQFGQFSPGVGQFSPGAASPGPAMSPFYTGGESSGYQPGKPGTGGASSPAYSPSSPAYSPSSPAYSPSSPAYSPSSPAYSPSSPAYSPSSPAYSPSSPAYSPSSPAYSPSSPAYSPSSPAYSPSSPAYSPSSPAYSPSSPAYSPSSPAYSPSSPAYSPSSPAYSPSSPAYSPSSPAYSPSSPAYSPSSPAYSPSSPAYSPSSPAYSPSSPAYSPATQKKEEEKK